MQTTCTTCDAELPLAEEGEYAGNCETCCEIYERRDAKEERGKKQDRVVAWVFSGLLICHIARWLLRSCKPLVADSMGYDPSNVISVIHTCLEVAPLVGFGYGVYFLVTLKEVDETPLWN